MVKFKTLVVASATAFALYSCSSNDDTVKEEIIDLGSNSFKVTAFVPAFGQFVNELPKYEVGDTAESMLQKADKALQSNGLISLGGFGGYVEVSFAKTIQNIPGKRDFRVIGNAFENNAEPGVILVAYDKNKNGKADADEWYEIAGSEHTNPATIRNYEITYYKPSAELDVQTGNIANYVKWTDNQGNQGYKAKNEFHGQSYYPIWESKESITFKGTLLPNNGVDVSGEGTYWQLPAFEFGYADNYINTSDESAIDIAWAVDANGNKVNLPGIDFIKVYTGQNQEAGWLGETSTEVSGFVDLHREKIDIQTRQ